jgi:Holliday junction resolvase RusA-like endonuclease
MTTPRILIIDIPHPPAALHPNARPHWRTEYNAKKKYKHTVGLIAIAEQGRAYPMLMKKARVNIKAIFNTNRRRDKDNISASLKYAFDSLQHAKLIENDNGLEQGTVEIVYDKNATPVVRLIIEEIVD